MNNYKHNSIITAFIYITCLIATLSMSQLANACDPYDYNSSCYGQFEYDTYDRPSDPYSNARRPDSLDIMLQHQERQRSIQMQQNQQLQNLYDEGRQADIMRELRQINEALRR